MTEVCLGCGKPTATSDCGCPCGTGFIMRMTSKCDHKFVDSKVCIKCGWSPK